MQPGQMSYRQLDGRLARAAMAANIPSDGGVSQSPTDNPGLPQQLARPANTGSGAEERDGTPSLTTGCSQVNTIQGSPEPARPKRGARTPAAKTRAPRAPAGQSRQDRQDTRQRCRLISNRDSARRTRQKQKDGLLHMQQQVEAAEEETLVLQKAVDEAEARRHKTEVELFKLQHSLHAVKEDNARLAQELKSMQDQVDRLRPNSCQDPPMLPPSPYTFPAAPPHLPDLPRLPSLPTLPPQDLGWCSPQAMLGPPTAFLPCSATMLRLPSAELLPGLGLLEDPVFLL